MQEPEPLDPEVEELIGRNMRGYLNTVSYRLNEYGSAVVVSSNTASTQSTSNSTWGNLNSAVGSGSNTETITNHVSTSTREKFYWNEMSSWGWRGGKDYQTFYLQCHFCDYVVESVTVAIVTQRHKSGALNMYLSAAQQTLAIHEGGCEVDE